jgi:DNA-binding beta-propeller fold protein YncE
MKLAWIALAACATTPATPTPPIPAPATVKVALPGGSGDGVGMDYLAFDPRTHAVWVPAGNTGAIDVIGADLHVTPITGMATREVSREGKTRVVGPSAATIGDGVVYVGSRGDSSICAFDEVSLAKRACAMLDSSPDGLAYVAATHEVWATTPRDKSIRVLDAVTLAQKARVEVPGGPEGFAVDRERFYTNVEATTVAIDLQSHAIVATWSPKCEPEDSHGLRLDVQTGWLFVACSSKIDVLDTRTGAMLGGVATGDGIDDIDYDAAAHVLYAGGARGGTLVVVHVDGSGVPTVAATIATEAGARNGVVDDRGRVFLAHSAGSELLVVPTR